MINKLLDAIAEALFQAYGSSHEIYTEKVEQGLVEPCFLIRCLDPTMNRDLDRRFKRTTLFSVQYFPATDAKVAECTGVLETLFDILTDLPVSGSVVHGVDLNGQITDDVLTFTVRYDLFVLKDKAPDANMDDLTVETEAKG